MSEWYNFMEMLRSNDSLSKIKGKGKRACQSSLYELFKQQSVFEDSSSMDEFIQHFDETFSGSEVNAAMVDEYITGVRDIFTGIAKRKKFVTD
jgi:hypothetical protein